MNASLPTAASGSSVAAADMRMIDVASIKPDPKNPRKHPKKQVRQIAASIRSFGFNVPVLVDADGKLIAGHGRLLAAKELGIQQVPVISLTHLTPDQARAFMIADNRLSEVARWDEPLLLEHFEYLQGAALGFEITDTGYELAEIDWMLESKRRRKSSSGEGDSPQGPAVCQSGDLWLLGRHRLLCGDARSEGAHERLMDRQKATMAFADPPYNVRIDGHAGGKGGIHHREFAMASGEMSPSEFTAFLQQVCSLMATSTQDGAIHFVCMDWRHARELLDATQHVYSEWKNLCVWTKDNGGMGSLYRSQHELVFVFKHGAAAHINNVELGRHGRNRSNVWEYPGINSFGRETSEGNLLAMHPTVKPVDLVADAILDCSRRGDVVLDPFMGSGTTLLAAERCGRIAYGMEIDPLYVDTTIRRWQAVTGDVARNAASESLFGEQQ